MQFKFHELSKPGCYNQMLLLRDHCRNVVRISVYLMPLFKVKSGRTPPPSVYTYIDVEWRIRQQVLCFSTLPFPSPWYLNLVSTDFPFKHLDPFFGLVPSSNQ